MPTSTPQITIFGPSSWNELVLLDQLPDPVPHMQFATDHWRAVGGTSAGKALHLTALNQRVTLHTLVADDADGHRLAHALRAADVDLVTHRSDRTERHLNLMTLAGERVSLYLSTPSLAPNDQQREILAALNDSEHAIIDLTETGRELIPQVKAEGSSVRIWTDLHDYDGASTFHEPFLVHADVVFMNADATDDAEALIRDCVARGPEIAVCTLGAAGAIAVDASGTIARVAAAEITEIVDTNGAGDAFVAGFMAANIGGASLTMSLRSGAVQAREALRTKHLHAALEELH